MSQTTLMVVLICCGVAFLAAIALTGASLDRSPRWSIAFAVLANMAVVGSVVVAVLLYQQHPGRVGVINLAIVSTWFVSSGWLLKLAIDEYRHQADFRRRMSRALARYGGVS